jgi:hypothetical protein
MSGLCTFLAPGQCYAVSGATPWRRDKQVTILLVAADAHGCAHITYRGPSGQMLKAKADQVEAAVAAGRLTPVIAGGHLARC